MAERIRIGPDGTIIRENISAPHGRVSAPGDTALETGVGGRTANGYNRMRHSRYTSAGSDIDTVPSDTVFDTDASSASDIGLLHSPPFFYVAGILLCGLIALLSYALLGISFIDTLSYRSDADWWQSGFAGFVPSILSLVGLGRGLYYLYDHHQNRGSIENRDYLRLLWAAISPVLIGSLAALAIFFLLPIIISIAKVALALAFLAFFFLDD